MGMNDPAGAAPRRKPRPAAQSKARRLYRDAALSGGRGFTLDKQTDFLAHLAEGIPRGQAAKLVGTNLKAVNDYGAKDPAFAAAAVQAEAEATEPAEVALRNLALGGHLTALMFYLQNRNPDRWKDMRRVTKEVTHTGTVAHELAAGPSIERIMLLQAQLEERKELRGAPETYRGDTIDVESEEPDTP